MVPMFFGITLGSVWRTLCATGLKPSVLVECASPFDPCNFYSPDFYLAISLDLYKCYRHIDLASILKNKPTAMLDLGPTLCKFFNCGKLFDTVHYKAFKIIMY